MASQVISAWPFLPEGMRKAATAAAMATPVSVSSPRIDRLLSQPRDSQPTTRNPNSKAVRTSALLIRPSPSRMARIWFMASSDALKSIG